MFYNVTIELFYNKEEMSKRVASEKTTKIFLMQYCKRVNKRFKKSYDLPLDLLQYRRENSAEYLYS